MSFQPEADDDSAELVFGIARRLSVVSESDSFFVEADAVKFKK
jgi:hypothetical protein